MSTGASPSTLAEYPWRQHTSPSIWEEDTEEVPTPTPTWSREQLQGMAQDDPDRLLTLVRGAHLRPSLLTFAAEILGETHPSHHPQAISTLLELLHHDSSLVREGALYGLARIGLSVKLDPRPIQALSDPKQEPSPGVREAAEEVLDTLGYAP
ncbi:MAG: HEAT repeat domain-containing protein [Deltaproteobacteria bacterium]|nr:HEAT repeat domain-containing protein [Deltaproteobacteria bacterium]